MFKKLLRMICGRNSTSGNSLDLQSQSRNLEALISSDGSLFPPSQPATNEPTLDASGSRRHWVENIEFFAPQLLPMFMASVSNTKKLMGDDDPQTRAYAVIAGYAIWRLEDDPQFIQECCDVVLHDAHTQPRMSAFYVLSLMLLRSLDRDIMRALAKVAKDPCSPIALRNDAYRAIRFTLLANSTELEPSYGRETEELLRMDREVIERIINDTE